MARVSVPEKQTEESVVDQLVEIINCSSENVGYLALGVLYKKKYKIKLADVCRPFGGGVSGVSFLSLRVFTKPDIGYFPLSEIENGDLRSWPLHILGPDGRGQVRWRSVGQYLWGCATNHAGG